jgi:NitT/TauT family transport system substrate-binding protein
MKNNLSVKTMILVVLINILVACTVASQPESRPNPPLRVEFRQWWGDYTLLVAKEKGLFNEYGVEVEPVYYDVFSDPYQDLAAGQIDGALIAVGDTININNSSPMKVVGILDNGGNDAVVVSPEINSVQQLIGKTIGVQLGSQYEMTIVGMLQSGNLGISDVTIVATNPEDALSALQSNKVQAAYTREPFLSDALSKGYKIIYPNEQLHLYPDMIVFRKSIVDERPEDVRAFLTAWFQAVEYRMQVEGETRDIAAKYMGLKPEDVPPDINLKILTLADNKSSFDIQNKNSIYTITKITSDYLISIGALGKQPDPLVLLDPSYLP